MDEGVLFSLATLITASTFATLMHPVLDPQIRYWPSGEKIDERTVRLDRVRWYFNSAAYDEKGRSGAVSGLCGAL